MADQFSLVAVLGSATKPGRLQHAVQRALDRCGSRQGTRTQLIDLAAVRIAAAHGRPADELDDDTAAVLTAIDAADAVLLATPVYRGSLTGVLKNLLDHVPVAALRQKPVVIAAMGASDHHFLGADRHLRDILAFFGAMTAPNAVYRRRPTSPMANPQTPRWQSSTCCSTPRSRSRRRSREPHSARLRSPPAAPSPCGTGRFGQD